jgi:RNA-directed DNA polymerase
MPVKTKTARQRVSRGRKRIAEWCRRNRHLPVVEQHQELCQKLRGHYAYYGLTGNSPWLRKLRQGGRRIWRKWLHRQSRTSSDMPWDRYVRVLERYRLPPVKIVHSVYTAKP